MQLAWPVRPGQDRTLALGSPGSRLVLSTPCWLIRGHRPWDPSASSGHFFFMCPSQLTGLGCMWSAAGLPGAAALAVTPGLVPMD